jgi:hypothetical protein
MDLIDFATGALVFLVIFDWITVALLFRVARAARSSGAPIRTIEDRGRTATLIAIGSTIAAFLGLNRHFGFGLAPELGIVLLIAAVVVPSLANLFFLVDLVRGEFGT